MRLGFQATLVGLAGWLAGSDARAGPEPAREVIVVADGLDAPALAEALALRVPEARVVPARCADVREDSRAGEIGHAREGSRTVAPGHVREDSAAGSTGHVREDGRAGAPGHVREDGPASAPGHVREDSGACAPACASGCTLARLRRDGEALRIEVKHADGRLFTRASAAEAGEPERAAAASLAHLLAAIEEGTATPGPADAPLVPPPSETVSAVARPSAPPCIAPAGTPRVSEPVVTPPVPRFEIGPVVGLTEVFGVGRPTALAGRVGDGGHVGVELRGGSGLLVGLELRGLGARDGGLHLGRLRVALAIGHSLRRGLFELRSRAALVVEPWWVGGRAAGGPTTAGTPLLGGALSVTPGLSAALAPRVRLFAGLRFEASYAADPRAGAIVQAVDTSGTPRFRLGGVELAVAAEIGVRWGVGARR